MHRQIAGTLTGRVTKWIVVGAWIVLLMALGPFAGKLTEVLDNEASSWLPDSAESTRALEKLTPFRDPNTIPTTVVYESETVTGPALAAIAAEDAQAFAGLEGLEGEPVPLPVAKDGQATQVLLSFNLGADGWNKMPGIADEIREIADHADIETYVAGGGGQAADAAEAFEGLDGRLIYATLLVVMVILLIVYRSAVLWLLPILSAFVALGCSLGLVYFLAKYAGLTVNGQSQAILSILVIGAGTDYALLLVARYREELRRHEDRHEAMAFALHRAAPAILASASTVALGLLVLMVAEMNSTAGMGPVVAIGVAVTFLVMVTFLPALLVIVGRWVFGPRREQHRSWVVTGGSMLGGGVAAALVGGVLSEQDGAVAVIGGILSGLGGFAAVIGLLVLLQVAIEHFTKVHSRPDFGSAEPTQTGFWARVGAMIARRPRVVWIGTTVLLGVACLGILRLDTSGLATEDQYTKEMESITGQKVLVEHGLADESNTVMVVADADSIEAVREAMTGIEGLAAPGPAVPPQDGVSLVEAAIFPDGASQAAFDVVKQVRERVHAIGGADALVGGGSAFYLDTQQASSRDSKVIIPVVLLVVLLILMALLRAVVAPLLLLGTVILSFGAAMGISALLFEYVFGFAGADPGFPLFAFVFLVALGIDYNIFLMTRVREETEVRGTRAGALVGLTSTGGVITSAGIVLAATFLVLGSLPLVFLAEMGIAVALGVMLDTMIVRSVLVTALNLDLGKAIWWPGNPEPEVLPEPGTEPGAKELVGV